MTKVKEIWKDISGYEGMYQASTFGNVRSLDYRVNTYVGGRLKRGRPVKQTKTTDGYLLVALYGKGDRKFSSHRIIAITFIPNPENKETVNHKDGNKQNNHIDNLEWNTRSENSRHAYNTGLFKRFFGKKLKSHKS